MTRTDNDIPNILEGTFLQNNQNMPLSETEWQWILELQQKITNEFDTNITLDDFIKFFNCHKENMASSYLGRHLGHYKAICQLSQHGDITVADTIVMIINMSTRTSYPLV
jgi:hypothetical protein